MATVMMAAAVTPRPAAVTATAVTARFTRRRNEPDEQDREE